MPSVQILHQEKNWIAVDKPVGISIHNNEDPTNLIKLLTTEYKFKNLFPVHRLDKETSGVQVFALDVPQAEQLAKLFQQKTEGSDKNAEQIMKIYYGIVRGVIAETNLSWKNPLSDKAEGRKNPAGQSKDRVDCETRVRVLARNKFFSLCEFNLITGRQHQIRKHSAIAKHALLGDSRYGDPSYNQKMAKIYDTDRMFLHCHKLKLPNIEIVSPVPDLFTKLLNPESNQL